jgi:hypothetical protein
MRCGRSKLNADQTGREPRPDGIHIALGQWFAREMETIYVRIANFANSAAPPSMASGSAALINLAPNERDREGFADLGFSEETIAKLFAQDIAGRAGFPNYALVNNSANIRRLEKRLAVIQNAQHDETTEERFPGGVRLVDNVEANRLQILFPEIPSEVIRRELQRNGFHWSPIAGAWQRHRSNRATYLAKLILTNHTPVTPGNPRCSELKT